MVAHSRAAYGPGRLRQLNRPRPLRVEASADGQPTAVWLSAWTARRPVQGARRGGRCHAVEAVLETWRIDDEWWREQSVSRVYYSLLLEDGRTVTVYRDEVSGRWWEQGY